MEKTIDTGSSQEDLQSSKVNRKMKRALPPLPESEDNSSYVKEHVDASKCELQYDKNSVDSGTKVKPKPKKGKSRRATQAKLENLDPDIENETESIVKQSETALKANVQDRLLLGVFVHQMDQLTNLPMSHLRVKIHVVDSSTRYYVKKEDRHHSAYACKEPGTAEYILPIMTKPFDLKTSSTPTWEEQIVFNKRFSYFIQQSNGSENILLFFELLGFISAENASGSVDADKHGEQPRTIAWAFLKIVGTNGALNTDSKLHLQLYCPPPQAKRRQHLSIIEAPESIEVYEWWRFYPRNQYPSALHVTVKGIRSPGGLNPAKSDRKLESIQWSRLPEQICQVPNRPMLSFHGGQMGCLTVLFSHAGTMLAAACADRGAYPVVVYEIPSGRLLASFSGHFKVIYDLCWSGDDRRLLSASSDGTVKEWNVEKLRGPALKVLSHPSFVYCARYHPAAQSLVLTGGYDATVRVWRVDVEEVNGQLMLEFEGHSGFINTICFDAEGSRMFSADSTGLIIRWETYVLDDQRLDSCHQWTIERKINPESLIGVPINMLQVHPNGRYLLIHAKDNVLRMMDLTVLLLKKYTGATNTRERIYSTFTPCGTYIFSGSEDGMAYVWNTDSGDVVAIYSDLWYTTGVHGVAFHPHENMVAFCAFGQPVHIYLYDPNVSSMRVKNIKDASEVLAPGKTKTAKVPSPDTSASLALDLFGQTRLVLKIRAVMKHLDSVLGERQISSLEFHRKRVPFAHTGRVCEDILRKELPEEGKKKTLCKGRFRLQQSGEAPKFGSELRPGEELTRKPLSETDEEFKQRLALLNQRWEEQLAEQKAELEKMLVEKEKGWRLREEENKREIQLLQQEILCLQVSIRFSLTADVCSDGQVLSPISLFRRLMEMIKRRRKRRNASLKGCLGDLRREHPDPHLHLRNSSTSSSSIHLAFTTSSISLNPLFWM